MSITKWVHSVVSKIKEAYNCNHTVGIHYDYADTELVTNRLITTEKKLRYSHHYVGDVVFFDYCPDCGERLPHKETYKDAIEMVQMPS
jgi:hypothetical protein